MSVETTDTVFADAVTNICHMKYDSLPKRGKPATHQPEWTLLSAILYTKDPARSPVVVAMGTGSKCIGQSKMSNKGNVLNDSHAEIITRRAFICFLLAEIVKISQGVESDVLEACVESEVFCCQIKEGVEFHMYTSHTPCGDASIFPKDIFDDVGEIVTECQKSSDIAQNSNKRKTLFSENGNKKLKLDPASTNEIEPSRTADKISGASKDSQLNRCSGQNMNAPSEETLYNVQGSGCHIDTRSDLKLLHKPIDIHRTGAKCVPGGLQDPKGKGPDYHCVGALRIKPGRGDRTISMSCSDKIARWNIVGCQGGLLSHLLLSPVYLKTLIIGRCPYSATAMRRALVDRVAMVTDLPKGYHVNQIKFIQSELSFCDGREAVENRVRKNGGQSKMRIRPSSSALYWYLGMKGDVGVVVNGKKQGVTAGNMHKPESRCRICPIEIYKQFHVVLSGLPEHNISQALRKCTEKRVYGDFKLEALDYQAALYQLKLIFKEWISKPRDHLQFTVSD